MLEAACALRAKIVRLAAHLLEASEADVELVDGHCRVRGAPGRALSLGVIAQEAVRGQRLPPGMDPGLEARFTYQPDNWTFPYGVHLVVVEVSRDLGTVTVLGYWITHDCGALINPMLWTASSTSVYNVHMKRYSMAQARQQFAELLDAAERGQPVLIERRGVRFVVEARRRPRPRRGRRRSIFDRLDPAIAAGEWTWSWKRDGLRFRSRPRLR